MNAKTLLRGISLALALAGLSTEVQSLPTEIMINPKNTYLMVNNDPADDAVPIDLAALGISPGAILRLTTLGAFNNGIGFISDGMTGVFSSNSVLLAQNQLHRVPGAIAAGTGALTQSTYFGNLATDIPQDFFIQSPQPPPAPFSTTNLSVRVPPSAAFLFVSAYDSLFVDDYDYPADHFRVRLELGSETILKTTLISANSVYLSWNTDSNQLYQVQSSSLTSGGWTNIGVPLLGSGLTVGITNSIVGQHESFYRVARVP
jgi:hypothetical protein